MLFVKYSKFYFPLFFFICFTNHSFGKENFLIETVNPISYVNFSPENNNGIILSIREGNSKGYNIINHFILRNYKNNYEPSRLLVGFESVGFKGLDGTGQNQSVVEWSDEYGCLGQYPIFYYKNFGLEKELKVVVIRRSFKDGLLGFYLYYLDLVKNDGQERDLSDYYFIVSKKTFFYSKSCHVEDVVREANVDK